MTSAAKEAARKRVAELTKSFNTNAADYLDMKYNETQARTDFVTPLLEAFGWDVYNRKGLPSGLREVVEEATVEVGAERASKRPDYELRLARQRKLFVEAKKPSVRIDKDKAAAFQVRRYGYSASLPISMLCNFHQLAIYDCIPTPAETDEAHVARLHLFSYEQFQENFDLLWDLLSREAVYSGAFDERFAVDTNRRGAQQFDGYFLGQIRDWRRRLAVDIHANTADLTPKELAYVVQLFLSRIVFLRICEDRDIEKYETLKGAGSGASFDELVAILRRADAFFNSSLFRLLDDSALGIRISDATLQGILSDLYYPNCPYTFAVVEAEVLGQIYEQFLGEEIIVEGGRVTIDFKPEVRESGGVVPTPRYVVDSIVDRTLDPLLENKSPAQLNGFTVADPCCGSGIFLLSAFERLASHYLDWYVSDGAAKHAGRSIYECAGGNWRLTFEEKRRILTAHIRGVDIDDNAVQVARLSLCVKLLEDDNIDVLNDVVRRTGGPVLPNLESIIRSGNSLVSVEEWRKVYGPLGAAGIKILNKIQAFNWQEAFPDSFASASCGFDAIIANPPYVRIQHMTDYSPEEAKYYKNVLSPYVTARSDNFDKYGLFVERSLSLLRPHGRLGVIIPNKFMSIRSGKALRHLLTSKRYLEQIIHFGVKPVFGPGTSNYTCILLLCKAGAVEQIQFEKVESLTDWRYGRVGNKSVIASALLSDESWQFADASTGALFDRVRKRFPEKLGSVAEIFVGVQTSADDVYIVQAVEQSDHEIRISWNGKEWPIELAVLRPCLYDVSLQAYSRPKANMWMIFPYEFVKTKERTAARLLQPDEMRGRFPGCLAYLEARRNELLGRQITGGVAAERQWYQYGRSQSLTKFNSPKIVLPALSREPKYAYDDVNTMVTGGGNGPYYLIRSSVPEVSDFYLLAVLNHPLSEAFIRSHTSSFRGGYYSHGKQFIEGLPIPIPGERELAAIEELVSHLLEATRCVEAARTPHARIKAQSEAAMLRDEIEHAVSGLFQLSAEDLDVARSVPIPE